MALVNAIGFHHALVTLSTRDVVSLRFLGEESLNGGSQGGFMWRKTFGIKKFEAP